MDKKVKKTTEKKSKYYYSKGTNKTSVSTARVYLGKGESTINGKPFKDFSDLYSKSIIDKPFILTGTKESSYFTVKSSGGGIYSQIKASVLALSRAISKIDESYKSTLSKNGLLKRDPRMVERKKYYRVKARKSPQFSKR